MTNREDGYTTVELMISLVILMTTVILVYSIYFFSVRWMRRWEGMRHRPQAAAMVLFQLHQDLRFCPCVDDTVKTAWMDSVRTWPARHYVLQEDTLWRDGWRLNDAQTSVRILRFFTSPPDDLGPDEAIREFGQRETLGHPTMEFELILGDTVRSIQCWSLIRYRNHVAECVNAL